MKLSDFDYFLPKELIAQTPLAARGASRLMVLERKNKTIAHRAFSDFPSYVCPGDIVVFNDTKVIPARLWGSKKGTLGKVDVLLVKKISPRRFSVLISPSVKIGQEIIFDNGSIKAQVVGQKVLEFNKTLSLKLLEQIGSMPLPPYIKRKPQESDRYDYQTVYAKKPGAIACPTAGLHFSKEVVQKIKNKKADICYVTLHVGLGTFKPVRTQDIKEHSMEEEAFHISEAAIKKIADKKMQGGRVFAVGTTTTRVLETAADAIAQRPPQNIGARHKSSTNLFIYPGYQFKTVDCLLTNFHLPKTTLLMLACAFGGRDLILKAYQEAVKEKYRFYSYGDAMLII